MAPQSKKPGAHIGEQAVRTIDGAPTAITAFVGRTQRGPVDEPIIVTSFVEFESIFGGLWAHGVTAHSVGDFFDAGGSTAVIVRVHQPGADDTASIALGTGPGALTLEAAAPGAWGSQLSAAVDAGPSHRGDPSMFNLTVVDGITGRIELFRDVSVATGSPRRVDAVVEQESVLVRMPGALLGAAPASDPVRATATGGNDGGPASSAIYTTGANLRTAHRGLYALDRVDPINLIVIPPYTAGGDVEERVVIDTIAYAEERRAVMIMDLPSTWGTPAAVVKGVSGPSFPASSHAATYYPRIHKRDPVGGDRVATFAPSGAVAGVIARTDTLFGVWKAPAGVAATLDGITDLAVHLSDDEIGELSGLGVNCLKTVPSVGHVIWGARTRAGGEQHDSEWKYLQVRRTELFIEDSVQRGLKWVAFEPNGEPLWSENRGSVVSFLDDLFQQGAFSGTRASEAYFVRCDSETTTRQDISVGVVNITLGFAPLKPAEFVTVKLQVQDGRRSVPWWRRLVRIPRIGS